MLLLLFYIHCFKFRGRKRKIDQALTLRPFLLLQSFIYYLTLCSSKRFLDLKLKQLNRGKLNSQGIFQWELDLRLRSKVKVGTGR